MAMDNWLDTEKNIKPLSEVPETTIAEFANTLDPDETAHLDLQCLPSCL